MKISRILKEAKKCELSSFILGTVYAYKYKTKNSDYLSVFFGRNQKTTKHTTLITDIDDQLKRIDSFYNSSIINHYSRIRDNEEIKKLLKGAVGRYRKFFNDLEAEDLIFDRLVYDFVTSADVIFVKSFVRGVIDSRSSADTTAKFVALDIRKKDAVIFSTIMIKACHRINVLYNINPRFTQKAKISRRKNPQFRIPYNYVFGVLGTFKYKFFEKVQINEKAFEWLNRNSQIPTHFKDIIIWDTKNVIYKKRSNKIGKDLEGDVAYSKGEKKVANEHFFASGIKQKYEQIYPNQKAPPRRNISKETRDLVWNNCRKNYFLEPMEQIILNRNKEPLFHCHHIIPHSYYHLFNNKNEVNSVENLVAVSPNTHDILHRGLDNEKRRIYLEKLFRYVSSFLEHQELLNKVTFEDFKRMYP